MSDKDTPFHRFQRAGGNEQQLLLLETALRESPQLSSMSMKARDGGDFTRLSLLDSGTRSGQYSGYYREVGLHSDVLKGPINQRNLDLLTNVFAHELSHALDRREMSDFSNAIERDAYDLAARPGPRDATSLVREYIDRGRLQESRAEIAGINAVADRMRNEGRGDVTESGLAERLFRASGSELVDESGAGFRFKPGIRFDPASQSVPDTPKNIEAVARHFFDTDRGEHGYREFYAAAAISALARGEAAYRDAHPLSPLAQTRIDLAALGVDPQVLRQQEFNFGEPPAGPFHFVDSSHGGGRHVDVAHTGPRRPGDPLLRPGPSDPMHTDRLPAQEARTAAVHPAATATDPDVERFLRALEAGDDATARGSAKAFANSAAGQAVAREAEEQLLAGYQALPGRDHPLFVQALTQLDRLGPEAGGYRDRVQMEDMAGAIAATAAGRKMPGIDSLSMENDRLVAHWRSPNGLLQERTAIDAGRAPLRPLEDSLGWLGEETRQREVEAVTRAQQQAQGVVMER
jgi:hypothetical protein